MVSCKSEDKVEYSPEVLEEVQWFANIDHYEKNKTAYQLKLKALYEEYISKGAYDDAKLLIYKSTDMLDRNFSCDTACLKTATSFLEAQFQPLVVDTTYMWIYFNVSDFYTTLSQPNETIIWAEKGIEKNNQTIKSNEIEAWLKFLIANAYNYTNRPEEAIQHALDVLDLVEKTQDKSILGSIYYSLAYSYQLLHAFNESDKMFQNSAEHYKNKGDYPRYFSLQAASAKNQFIQEQDTTASIAQHKDLLSEFQSLGNPEEIHASAFYELKSFLAYLTKDFDSAMYYNNALKKLSEEYEENFFLAYIEKHEALIYFGAHGFVQDERKLIDLIDKFQSLDGYFESLDLYHLLYLNALNKRDIVLALEYRNKEIELKEMILEKNQEGQLFELKIKYEAEKKEARLAQQQEVILKNNLIIALLIVSLALLIFGFLIFIQFKKRKLAQIETQRQEQFTNQLMENTEEERSRIANELHDSVNHELLTIKNNLTKGNNIQAEDIGKVIEEVRNISRNLHPAILEKLGLEASIEHLCDKLTESGLFTTCEVEYTYKLTKNKELQLYRIIQEALNNTLKHGKANAAKVILTSRDNYLLLEIKDNGSGFNVHEQLNNPKSFGLQSIMQRAKTILAKVNIDSSPKGTIILIKIPVS